MNYENNERSFVNISLDEASFDDDELEV